MIENVRRGFAKITTHRPGWKQKVNLNTLHMAENCILMQVFGSYIKGLSELGLKYDGSSDPKRLSCDSFFFGFNGPRRTHPQLVELWKKEIAG
jgi:hypothetical protein